MLEFLTNNPFFLYLGGAMLTCLCLAFLLLFFVMRSARNINVPEGADFWETMQHTPFSVALLIDLFDFGLDVLSAPITWLILDRLGLKALRGFGLVEGLLPFTGPIPTMTVGWFISRLMPRPKPIAIKD